MLISSGNGLFLVGRFFSSSFFAALWGLWDLNSLASDRTCAPYNGSSES